MTIMRSVFALFMIFIGIINATTITTPSTISAVIAALAEKLPSQMAPDSIRCLMPSLRHVSHPTNLRCLTPSFRHIFRSNKSHRLITTACKPQDSLAEEPAPEIKQLKLRPIPEPITCPSAVIVFHKAHEVFDHDTCVLTLQIFPNDTSKFFEDLVWALDMAQEKLKVAGYSRAALLISRKDLWSSGGGVQIRIAKAGFRGEQETASSKDHVPQQVILMKDLSPSKDTIESNTAKPVFTLSGAVQSRKHPDLVFLAHDTLSFDYDRFAQICKESVICDIVDIKLKILQSKLYSHAVVMLDDDGLISVDYKKVANQLEQLGFRVSKHHPMQSLTIPYGKFWLKEL